MKYNSRRAGVTLIELMMVTIILFIGGLVLFEFVKSTYGAQDTISGQNSADATARQVIDTLADELRNSQWFNPYDALCQAGCGSGTAEDVTAGTATSITFYRNSLYGNQSIQYSLSGTNLQKSVDGATAVTVLTGVQSLTFTYYSHSPNTYDTLLTLPLASADYPLLGTVGIDATVSVTQLNTYSRRYQSLVRLRNSPPPT